LVRNYLAIPTTSAAIERIFSFSNNIITKSRNRLHLDTVKKVIFLKSWGIKTIQELEEELGCNDHCLCSKGLGVRRQVHWGGCGIGTVLCVSEKAMDKFQCT